MDKWYYFAGDGAQATLNAGFLNNPDSWRNIGIIFGALLVVLLASQFKIKKIKSWKQVIAAVLGGLLMGYGARIGYGCNIGALFSGIASLSLSGWVLRNLFVCRSHCRKQIAGQVFHVAHSHGGQRFGTPVPNRCRVMRTAPFQALPHPSRV